MEQQAIRGRKPAEAAGRRPSLPTTRFTPLELAAAEQLIHLSESSCSTGAAFTPRGSGTAASACYSSSSPRSVNAPPSAPACDDLVVHAEDEEDDDEQEVGERPRRKRRYRSVAEIYEATEPCGARRRKAKAGAAAAAGGTMEQRRKKRDQGGLSVIRVVSRV